MVNAWIGGVGTPPTQTDFSPEVMYDSMFSKRTPLITALSGEVLSLYNSLTYCVVFYVKCFYVEPLHCWFTNGKSL
jgi:hypothetical protein